MVNTNCISHTDKKKIQLDYGQQLFQLMWAISWHDFEIRDGRVYNKILGTKPAFLHFNGNCYESNEGVNVMPIFIEKAKKSLLTKETYDMRAYKGRRTTVSSFWKGQRSCGILLNYVE